MTEDLRTGRTGRTGRTAPAWQRGAAVVVVIASALVGGAGCVTTRTSIPRRAALDGLVGGVILGAPVVLACLPVTGPIALAMGNDAGLVVMFAPGVPTGIVGWGLGTALALPVEALRGHDDQPHPTDDYEPPDDEPCEGESIDPAEGPPLERAPPAPEPTREPVLDEPPEHPEDGPCPLCGRPGWHLRSGFDHARPIEPGPASPPAPR